MEPIKTHALQTDENGNIILLFGNRYVGIEPCYVTPQEEGGEFEHCIKFCELQKPFNTVTDKDEDYQPRTDLPNIVLMFSNAESLDTVIHNLQLIREKMTAFKLLNKKMEDQDLPIRTLNVLREAEIVTVRDLVRYKRADLLKYRNFGKVSLRMLDEWLQRHHLWFGMTV